MKIKYDLNKNSIINITDEFLGLDICKHFNKKGKYLKYTYIVLIQCIITLLLMVIGNIFGLYSLIKFLCFFTVFIIIEFVLYLIVFLVLTYYDLRGELLIDEFGITDTNNKFRSGISWDYIRYVVFTKDGVYFVCPGSIYIYSIKNIKDIKKAIDEYKSDLLVIDKRK